MDPRTERSRQRRRTWQLEPLTDRPPEPPDTPEARLRRLEVLRRAAFAMQGVAYPEGPTSRDERRRWPVERIG